MEELNRIIEKYENIPVPEDIVTINNYCEVLTTNGWIYGKDLHIGDIVVLDDDIQKIITNIVIDNSKYTLYLEGGDV